MSNNFNKEKFERIFRIKRFEIENRQSKEFRELAEKFARENIRGSYSIDARFEMKGNHFKEILDIWIESLFESFASDEITSEDNVQIQTLFKNYSNRYIENERSGFQSAMLSYGHTSGSSIIKDALANITNKLNVIRSVQLDKIIIEIDKHNSSLVIENNGRASSFEKNYPKTENVIGKIENDISDKTDWFELKPNFFGIGFNLNNIIKDIRNIFKRKKKS
ncbi:MAG TPA: hypothetical protein PKE38_16350 [Ignavibacteriaceae bacterium]|nr:hypothetical protein [Ignavibacteriaceae bacterium]